MNATSIILLVGVVGLLVVGGFVVSLMGKIKKTIDKLDKTIDDTREDMARLTPLVAEALQQVGESGKEIGRTAEEVKILTHRINSTALSPVVSGTANYLPLLLSAVKMVKPLFSKGRRH